MSRMMLSCLPQADLMPIFRKRPNHPVLRRENGVPYNPVPAENGLLCTCGIMIARPNANGYQAHVFNFQEQQCLLLSRKRRTQ